MPSSYVVIHKANIMQVAFWPKAPKRQPALKLLHLLGTPSKSSGRIGTASKLRQLNERLQSIRYSLHHKCFMPILSLGYIPSYALGKVASRPRWPLLLGIPSISGLKFRTGYNHACSQRSFSSSFNSLQGQTEKLIFKNPTAVTWLTQTPFAIVGAFVFFSFLNQMSKADWRNYEGAKRCNFKSSSHFTYLCSRNDCPYSSCNSGVCIMD